MSTCIHPFDTENHPAEIVNVHTGKMSNNDINVDKCVEIGSEQVIKHCLKGFTTHLVSRLKLCLSFRRALE